MSSTNIYSSSYIEQQRRSYSLYVLQSRAIPNLADGLKAAARRALWTGRDGKKYKTASLAGATMPLHPHDECSGAIDTITAPYGNNIPLFTGIGALGTLLNPKAYGAARYTTVYVSEFTKDVVFSDIEIIPMVENYDSTLEEPLHFLPLVPISLLNPSEGIAIGFAADILPRSLDDIIVAQLAALNGATSLSSPLPNFTPTNSRCISSTYDEKRERQCYHFEGDFVEKDTSSCTIVSLPYSKTHQKAISYLDELIESGSIVDYIDRSKREVSIEVKFQRGFLRNKPRSEILTLLGLTAKIYENLNVIDLCGKRVISPTPGELIQMFTLWRLSWYPKRYQRLLDILIRDLQRYYDIKLAIDCKINVTARNTSSRDELKELLQVVGVVDVDYIADLPLYRFTESEYLANEAKIVMGEQTKLEYQEIIQSVPKQKKLYATELNQILTKYLKGGYSK